MTRATYVLRDGELVDVRDLAPVSRSKGPIIIGDNIPDANGRAVLNHADGKHYSSRSQYYAAVKRSGSEITGTDRIRQRPAYEPQGVGTDVKRAIAELKSR